MDAPELQFRRPPWRCDWIVEQRAVPRWAVVVVVVGAARAVRCGSTTAEQIASQQPSGGCRC